MSARSSTSGDQRAPDPGIRRILTRAPRQIKRLPPMLELELMNSRHVELYSMTMQTCISH